MTKPSRRQFVQSTALGMAGIAAANTITSAAAEKEPTRLGPYVPTVFDYGYDKEPYPLDPGPHLFLDWRYVLPGRTRYQSPTGESVTSAAEGLHGKVGVEQIVVHGDQSAQGIRLQVQPATKVGPVIPNDKPWEYSLCYPTLGYFDGKYRMWYEVIAPRENGSADLLCYAESSDGVKWEKPELGLVTFAGNKKNNIVYDESVAGHSFHGVGVFYDHSAPAEHRYKLVYNCKGSADDIAQLKSKLPASVSPLGESKALLIRCASSPDGIHWKPLPQPLMSQMSDTGSTMYYDEVLRRYVGYFRMTFMNRRVIGRSEGATLDQPWPAPEVALWSDPGDIPSTDYYTNGKSLYPGTKTAHFMFPTIYLRFSDSSVVRMVASLDGKSWMLPPGGNILEPGSDGTWDGGCVFAGNGLAEISGDCVALPYIGYGLPHKFPRLVRCGEVGLATWQKHRLTALIADEEGEFHTQPFKFTSGDTLRLNFDAKRDGFVKVEAVGQDGRKLEDCDPLWGDRLGAVVKWKGQAALQNTQNVTLRFRLRSAKLFSFEIV